MVPPTARYRATNTNIKMSLLRPRTRTTLKALRSHRASHGRPPPTLSHTVTRPSLRPLRAMPRMLAHIHRKLTTHLLMQAQMSHNDKAPTKDITIMVKTMARRRLLASASLLEATRNQQLPLHCHLALTSPYGAPQLGGMTSLVANIQVNYPTEERHSRMPRSPRTPLQRRCLLGPTTPRMSTMHSTTGHPVQIPKHHLSDPLRTPDQHRPACNDTQRMHHCQVDLSAMSLLGVLDTNESQAIT
jgi:hypothetical protein